MKSFLAVSLVVVILTALLIHHNGFKVDCQSVEITAFSTRFSCEYSDGWDYSKNRPVWHRPKFNSYRTVYFSGPILLITNIYVSYITITTNLYVTNCVFYNVNTNNNSP